MNICKFICSIIFVCGFGLCDEGRASELSTKEKIAMLHGGQARSFEYMSDTFCMLFVQIERNELSSFIVEIEENGIYPGDDFFNSPKCQSVNYGESVKSPMLHLVADDPNGMAEYEQVFFKYYTKRRKDNGAWLRAINAKNTLGETTLDFFKNQIDRNKYTLPETKAAVNTIIRFICSKGAVYSKYPDTKCPD